MDVVKRRNVSIVEVEVVVVDSSISIFVCWMQMMQSMKKKVNRERTVGDSH
jgi:hypothetical protein